MPNASRKPRISSKTGTERDRAKRIIVEIVRQHDGDVSLKASLYEAFYHAHLWFAERSSGYLSAWPMVRMPDGPAIDGAQTLLNELVADGMLRIADSRDYEGFSFAIAAHTDALCPMTADELAAIRYGVRCAQGKTAAAVNRPCQKSRAWRKAKEGEELNIYADLSNEGEYRKRAKLFHRVNPAMEDLFAQARGSETKRTSA